MNVRRFKIGIRFVILVVASMAGLSVGLGRDLLELESRFMGNGRFDYRLRTLEDPFFAGVGIGVLAPNPFTNYLSNTLPLHWTNFMSGEVWNGILYDGSGPQARINEVSFSVYSSSFSFKRTQYGFFTGIQLTLADCLGGETFGGYINLPCLIPCAPEEADNSPDDLIARAELIPDLKMNELILTNGSVHGLRFTWNMPSTVELQGSHDLAQWTAVARLYGDSPQTTWITNASLNSFGEFFRLRLITNSHPSSALVSTMSPSQPQRLPERVIVNHFGGDDKAVTVGFTSVSNLVYEVDHCEAVGRVIETKRVTATSAFTTADFDMTEPRRMGFFKVRQVIK
jgi:hypothetical protein